MLVKLALFESKGNVKHVKPIMSTMIKKRNANVILEDSSTKGIA